jgi:hypothetical protein
VRPNPSVQLTRLQKLKWFRCGASLGATTTSLLKHAMQLALYAKSQWTARALTERKDSHRTAERESLGLPDGDARGTRTGR